MVGNVGQPSQAPDRGASLGLPASGPGSLAPFSRRVGGYAVDAAVSLLIAWAFTAPALPGNWSLLVFGVLTVGTLAVFGQTPGHRVLGMRLAHPTPGARLAPWRAVVRTALLILLVPALIVDADGRGLHDRLTGTAVVLDR
ncbi:RDD family protein [Blastococcus xanthinilyticus]|uniref:RDD family protein n=1 Tax=Blastococcus xanthinilyticus TaxID=1564164 RepID=A0A5S5CXC9_9ACTN|nr:RDD family protein [Blastococcus xanthinilyticus]TYP88427.1 RDD family protein [Blastococcus xanthinilyticus]